MMTQCQARRQARAIRRAARAAARASQVVPIQYYTVERDKEWPTNPLEPLPYAGTGSVFVPRKVNRNNAKSSILDPIPIQ